MPHCASMEAFMRCALLGRPAREGKSTQPMTRPSARTTVNVQYRLLSSSYQRRPCSAEFGMENLVTGSFTITE